MCVTVAHRRTAYTHSEGNESHHGLQCCMRPITQCHTHGLHTCLYNRHRTAHTESFLSQADRGSPLCDAECVSLLCLSQGKHMHTQRNWQYTRWRPPMNTLPCHLRSKAYACNCFQSDSRQVATWITVQQTQWQQWLLHSTTRRGELCRHIRAHTSLANKLWGEHTGRLWPVAGAGFSGPGLVGVSGPGLAGFSGPGLGPPGDPATALPASRDQRVVVVADRADAPVVDNACMGHSQVIRQWQNNTGRRGGWKAVGAACRPVQPSCKWLYPSLTAAAVAIKANQSRIRHQPGG